MLDATFYTDLFDFKLLYETYNNGVVKNAKYKSGDNKTEYLITFDKSGQVSKIEKYKNGKKTGKELK
jgi:antitoxin component YwqK of YwqJK toxin-antitoxin module